MALEFKEKFLGKKMQGKIKGIKLPKLYNDFTQREKKALIKHNPNNKDFYFKKEVSEPTEENIQPQEQKEEE